MYRLSIEQVRARVVQTWGLPLSLPGYLPNPWIKPTSPALQADSLLLSHQGSWYKEHYII